MINLLLVDDDFNFLNTISSVLKTNFNLYTATGVADAKQVFMSEDVDAVCSDFNMRDGTGLELLEWLREKGNTIPFLLLSATEDTFLVNAVSHYGASFCGKTDYDLIEKISSIVKSKPM